MRKVKLSLEEVRTFCNSSLLECGASLRHASAITETLTAAERDGCSSHGLFRLPSFLESLLRGTVDGAAEAEVAAVLPGVVRVDARGRVA